MADVEERGEYADLTRSKLIKRHLWLCYHHGTIHARLLEALQLCQCNEGMGFLRRLFGGRWKRSARDPNRKGKSRLTFPAADDAIGISISSSSELDANKHALAVAAATAAVAEAAIAAAQAAAEVVRLTGGGAGSSGTAAVPAIAGETRCRLSLEDFAALRIQSAFRGYLVRAFRAHPGILFL
ncbi:hypothetical protein SAY86_023176 [Trapa natans]|uniref:Uncharacterized protein n=1 Tax=Trapa natans TaxID=22666 RepID=A0AAN7M9Z2_TRANT|nr:hypothetical protein SAY86_023176 [Trapa natans]